MNHSLKFVVCRVIVALTLFLGSFIAVSPVYADEVYSNLNSDATERISTSYNYIIQTLGTGLSGQIFKIKLKTKNLSAIYYGSKPVFILYECDNDTYNNFDQSGCLIIYNETSADRSQLEESIQTFYPEYISLNPSKYYYFASRGNNQFNTLPYYFGGSQDVVAGSCLQKSILGVRPCETVADLYFEIYGVVAGDIPCTENCFSNVLFLPGIKGSVLKIGSDTLWPPSFLSNDIPQLAITTEGESLNDISVDGILNKFYGTDVYKPFSDFMDSISGEEKLINRWLPMPYDWRFLPDKIVSDGIKTPTAVLDVIDEVEKLADDSKTGKVTIVAHSMGGLLGKAIIKKLQEEGKSDLIDSFVMVGTPQLGTPQATASVLHGDGEGIAAGFIVNPIGLRRIAQDMPSVYGLLPSSEYFNSISDPVVTFDTNSTFTQTWRDLWGTAINTYSNFTSFLTGGSGVRTKLADNKLNEPEVLRSDLLTSANNFHSEYDNYQFPENIRVVQVAGWGIPTPKGIKYKTSHGVVNYEPLFTREGDKTVVYASATSSTTDETYFFNIFDYNKHLNSNAQHRDILSVISVQDLIELVVKRENFTDTDFISTVKPVSANIEDQLVVSTHSPVILGAYDENGNFTGIDLNQDLSAEILSIKEEIPGSTFSYTSESQYIFLPKNGVYDFVYKGIGEGPTTVMIDHFINDALVPVVAFTDIPTTPDTIANFEVQSATPESAEIALDLNGTGTTEIIYSDGNAPLSLNELVILLKEKISSLVVKDGIKKNLLNRLASFERKIETNKTKTIKLLNKLGKKVSKQEIKDRISTGDAQALLDIISQIEAVIK